MILLSINNTFFVGLAVLIILLLIKSLSKSDKTADIEFDSSIKVENKKIDNFDYSAPFDDIEVENELPITIEEELPFVANPQINYNPLLDLPNYQYPQIDLFENSEMVSAFNRFSFKEQNFQLPFILSDEKDIKDFANYKNILITGTQETGKTNFIHQLLFSFLVSNHPSKIKFVIADAKGIEFKEYTKLERQFLAKLQGNDPIISNSKDLFYTLNSLCIEMDNRYDLLKDASCRNVSEYNNNFVEKKLDAIKGHQYLPTIIFIVDDLSAFYQEKSEIQSPLIRLINEGHKVGLYNIICSNQFTHEKLSNDLLSLLRHRIIFRLNSNDNYKKFFDTIRIDKNLHTGEFLYNLETSILKGKSIKMDFKDIESLCLHISNQDGYPDAFLLPEYVDEKEMEGKDFDSADRDPLFGDAAKLIVQNQVGSTSLIQRRMKLGYNRAGRLMDQLEASGIVGPNLGSKAREVRFKSELELQEYLDSII